jgi:integrase
VARPRKSIPSYRLHRPSGHAYSDFTDPLTGRRRSVCLGLWDSPESRAEHARLVAEVAVGRPAPAAGLTVNELLLAFLRHAQAHYRRADGTLTDEVANYKQAFRLVREAYGHTPAAAFGPLALKAVRQRMIDRGWCRRNVNQQVGRVRRVFKWGVENELVPPPVLVALKAVGGLQAGRSAAKETAPVPPVEDAVVDATLPHLNRHVAGLVRFQRLTGCRPGEAVAMRRCDLVTAGPVWVFRPPQHKVAHKNLARAVFLGPQAQALLTEFPTVSPDEYVFSPRREREERNAKRAAERTTKYYASRQGRQSRKAHPKRVPGARYTVASYGYAIRRACAKRGLEPWAPNQLRHSFATEVRKAHGLEAAQVLLGHARADVTQVYAERNEELAARVAGQVG